MGWAVRCAQGRASPCRAVPYASANSSPSPAPSSPPPPNPLRARQAVAGLAADGRAVVDRAQSEAQQYKGFYGHCIPGHVLAERLASYVHVFNLYWYVRPMGVTSLLGVYDEEGPALYAVDPAGTVHRYYGTAVGKGRQAARNEIEKLRPGELTVREGVRAVAQILHRVHDEEKPFEAELAWVCEESGRTFQRVPQASEGGVGTG